ncbi:MAG: hypothetical protein QOE45_2478 [Frankiaceae bacterium]|jgi:hypothetical protein|nr:hypothetical protein [Frankiaceae bacterium]
MSRSTFWVRLALGALVVAHPAGPANAAPPRFERISAAYAGAGQPAVTPDGRFVLFTATPRPPALQPNTAATQAYVHVRASRAYETVSVSSAGKPGDAHTQAAAITPDGRYVALASRATNFAPKAQTTVPVFVRDRVARTTVPLFLPGLKPSGSAGGVTSVAISANGRYVAFSLMGWDLVAGNPGSGSQAVGRVYLADRSTRRLTVVSTGADGRPALAEQVGQVALSADGRYVAFSSPESLTPDDRDAGRVDVYVRDVVARRTALVSGSLADDADYRLPRLDQAANVVAFLAARSTGSKVEVVSRAGTPLRALPGPADVGWTTASSPAVDPSGRVVGYVGGNPGVLVSEPFGARLGTSTSERLTQSDQPWCALPGCGGNALDVALSRDAAVAVLVTSARLTSDDLDNDADVYVRS